MVSPSDNMRWKSRLSGGDRSRGTRKSAPKAEGVWVGGSRWTPPSIETPILSDERGCHHKRRYHMYMCVVLAGPQGAFYVVDDVISRSGAPTHMHKLNRHMSIAQGLTLSSRRGCRAWASSRRRACRHLPRPPGRPLSGRRCEATASSPRPPSSPPPGAGPPA